VLAGTGFDAARSLVSITIEDSGPGIAAGQLEAATPGAGSSKPFGLGLGLRLCREIVAEHGGTLELGTSAALGGASARIELPTCAPA
jgi:C4-dicarboxylate-specific signal transduction histidine kinase